MRFEEGSSWLWEEQRKHLTHADGGLDIFHVLEHITAAGQAMFSHPDRASEWITKAREALLNAGWSGIDAHTRPLASPAEVPRSAAHQRTIDELRNYTRRGVA